MTGSETASPTLVSVHGGHTAQFGDGADSLEEVVGAYAARGFEWVGITEHIPPVSTEFLSPEEIAAGPTAESRLHRFAEYFSVARELQSRYQDSIRVLIGFETECCTGYIQHVESLRNRFQPDYIVGSIHHVRDIIIDWTPEQYAQASELVGGIDALYCEYFDQQHELITALRPKVIGHFDLIRMHDKDYRQRLEQPKIKERIRRNLELIKELGSILDFNLRAFEKGATEPYVSQSILQMALELGVLCAPGDDSHGVATVGLHLERGIEILQQTGFSTDWPVPSH